MPLYPSYGAASLVANEVPAGTINGSNVSFTLAAAPANGNLDLYRNGIRLKLGADYSLTGNAITMGLAPQTGAILLADYVTTATSFNMGTNSIISDETPSPNANNGTNKTFTLSRAYIAGTLEVYFNGIKQKRGSFFTETTPASGVFTTSDAPQSGDYVTCNYQFALNSSGNSDTVDGIHANATPTANQLLPLDGTSHVPVSALAYTTTYLTTSQTTASTTPVTLASLTGITATGTYLIMGSLGVNDGGGTGASDVVLGVAVNGTSVYSCYYTTSSATYATPTPFIATLNYTTGSGAVTLFAYRNNGTKTLTYGGNQQLIVQRVA